MVKTLSKPSTSQLTKTSAYNENYPRSNTINDAIIKNLISVYFLRICNTENPISNIANDLNTTDVQSLQLQSFSNYLTLCYNTIV